MITATFSPACSIIGYSGLKWLKRRIPVSPLAKEALGEFLKAKIEDPDCADIPDKDFTEMSITEDREVILAAAGLEPVHLIITGRDGSDLIALLMDKAFLL